jgi:3-oxoacyl-[acyl-carrier protein] reductase
MRLRDRVAVITGAGSGIGAASALAMAREGARVVVGDIDEAGARATAAAIEKDGGQAMAVRADVSRATDNDTLVHRAVATWGRLDIFFANAGVPQPQASIGSVDEATIDHVLAVNVKGVLLGARAALPIMKKARRGVALITASTAALRPRGGHVYAASKGAVVTLAGSLAMEAAPHGVRVVAIAPVATETPMLAQFAGKSGMSEEMRLRTIATVPLGRLNQPEDLARTAVFLASDDAAMITGSCIAVDGGRCI